MTLCTGKCNIDDWCDGGVDGLLFVWVSMCQETTHCSAVVRILSCRSQVASQEIPSKNHDQKSYLEVNSNKNLLDRAVCECRLQHKVAR